jgi:arginine decarboxylase
MEPRDSMPVLVVHDASEAGLAVRTAIKQIIGELECGGMTVLEADGYADGELMLRTHPELGAVLAGWAESSAQPDLSRGPGQMLAVARARFNGLPAFLMTEGLAVQDLSPELADSLTGTLWLTEDTPQWTAGHIRTAVRQYRDSLLPPFFGALARYVDEYRYSWHTPGHMGGLAFLKSPAGRLFFDFVGERFLRADISSSVPELGSVLEHEGVVAEAEANAARVFGADDTYFVTNGTTMSNQIVFRATVSPGDVVLLDRNCHKSIVNSVIQTGAIPIWLQSARNHLGLIGPITAADLTPAAIRAKIAASPLAGQVQSRARLAVVTSSTYDGTMYDAAQLVECLGQVADHILLDEAWIPYAAFHPVYAGHFGMAAAREADPAGPTVVTTMSTHKMLAALSQASMIHIRHGHSPLPRARFNEAFMLHTSTSPQYGIVASLDVATRMMEGQAGRALVDDAVGEAISFRREVASVGTRMKSENTWWFSAFQPSTSGDPAADRWTSPGCGPAAALEVDQDTWQLDPGRTWHGFGGLRPGQAMLDPVKVTLVTPGIQPDGTPASWGIPAGLVSAFLRCRGVVVEKTGYYSILVLFSIAVTRGKSGTLLAELFDFHRAYQSNMPVATALPEVHAAFPGRYADLGLRDLATQMHAFLSDFDTARMQAAISDRLPEPVMTPAAAFAKLVHGDTEEVPLAKLDGRISAVTALLYPPGIPVVVPGERFDPQVRAITDYLKLFEQWDSRFPGFENEVQGVVRQRSADGSIKFSVSCVTESSSQPGADNKPA